MTQPADDYFTRIHEAIIADRFDDASERRALLQRLRELGHRLFDRIRIQAEPPMPRLKARLKMTTSVEALLVQPGRQTAPPTTYGEYVEAVLKYG